MGHLRRALITAALFAVACGGNPSKKPEGATGPDYKGEPLFVVSGQLALTNGNAPAAPIRLALAWYPDQSANSAPKAVVTQDVQYQGSFPLNYTFSFFSVPPSEAFVAYAENGQSTNVAWGTLLAYDDKNGNGGLDPIVSGGSPVDDVLGSAIGDFFNGSPAAEPAYIAYVDGTPLPSWAAAGYQAGYNLVKGGKVVPASSPVPITLDDTHELNLLVCEELLSGQSTSMELPCNIPATGGVRVVGNVFLQNGVGGGSVRVSDGVQPLTNATVELNGQPLPYMAQHELYYGWDPSLKVHADGQNELKVTVPGKGTRVFQVVAAGDFILTSPAEGTLLRAGSPISVTWTAAANTQWYSARAYSTSSMGAMLDDQLLSSSQLSATLKAPTADDYHGVGVVAWSPDYFRRGLGGSVVSVSVSRTAYVDVIPAAQDLLAQGALTLTRFGTELYHSAWLQAFDGTSVTATAQVEVNGTALVHDATFQMFTAEGTATQLNMGGANTVTVTAPGKASFSASVNLPGDFQLTQVPATAQVGTAIPLAWTASPGANGYSVTVYDVSSQLLHHEQVQGTSAQLPGFSTAGDVYVYVAAIGQATDRHLSGELRVAEVISITP